MAVAIAVEFTSLHAGDDDDARRHLRTSSSECHDGLCTQVEDALVIEFHKLVSRLEPGRMGMAVRFHGEDIGRGVAPDGEAK